MVNPVALLIVGGTLLVAFSWPWASVKQTDKSTYPLATHSTLSIENASGDIHIDAYDGSTVNIVAHRQASSNDALAQVKVEVVATKDKLTIRSIYPPHCVNCDISYEILVPRSAALVANDESGDVRVSGMNGDIDVNTESGDIAIHQAGGRVFAEAASGKISIDGAAGVLRAKTASGDISVRGSQGNVEARASSGNVSARFTSIGSAREIKLEALSGDVLLTMPRGTSAAISAETAAGSIQTDFGQAPREGYAGATLAQRIGDGTVKIDLSAASGSIRLRAI
jgi:hypothetical protein